MYRKIVWCYIIVLTLLDISLNSKLTAQGKSHGDSISVHDSLVEGITFQEWGKDGVPGGGGGGGEGAGLLRLEPAALALGRRALGQAHAASVTLTNTANTTLHLASVAGTTPDFHASFFDSKTLPPDGNTTFSVVYLGRREGVSSAHLYIHTSLGVHKYPVSAEGVASPWDVWPLLGLRVPSNASLEPVLTLRNPTDTPVQVSEVYSTGGWVRLSLPGGGGAAPAAAWLVPPHAARAVVRLHVAPPSPHQSLAATAYVRIKANITGGGLVVAVEARSGPAGEFTQPLQLRLGARGAADPPATWEISVGSSSASGARLEAGVTARCEPRPPPAPAPSPAGPARDDLHEQVHRTTNGVKSEGAFVSVTRAQLDAHQPPAPAALLTLDYEKLWAGYLSERGGGGGEGDGGEEGAWCAGAVRLGRASVPYSLRLLPGTLQLSPPEIDLVTADRAAATREVELRARNLFHAPVRLAHLHLPPEVTEHVSVWGWTPRTLAAGADEVVVRLRLRAADLALSLDARLRLTTNVTEYVVPLRVYSGKLRLEWEWPNSEDGNLDVGAVGTSSTRHIRARVVNPCARALCVTAARALLPGAQLALAACAHRGAVPPDHPCRCIEGGGSATAVLTLVAPARAGALRGTVSLSTAHATTEGTVTLTAHSGRLFALPVTLDDAAPYSWSSGAVTVDNSMSVRMRVSGWSADEPADPALSYEGPADGGELAGGRAPAGRLHYRPEDACRPHCYTGLDPASTEGASWVSSAELWRGPAGGARGAALRADRALLEARRALYRHHTVNVSLHLHTTQVVQVPVLGWVRLRWPRLAAGAAWAGLAPVGGASELRLSVRNPSQSHPLLLQPVLGPPPAPPLPDVWEGAESSVCEQEECLYALDSFTISGWRAVRGDVRLWAPAGPAGGGAGEHADERAQTPAPAQNSTHALPVLRLAAGAELQLTVSFSPREPSALTAYLYLRNNLTIVEGLQLAGRGAYPSFEIGGRRPGAAVPLVFEVTECGGGGAVRRQLAARNTGLVPVRLADWRLAGEPCAARGFTLEPCAPLTLQPNRSAPLAVAFHPDYTLARVPATLEVRTERARLTFRLVGVTAPRLLARCSALAPRPSFEPGLRSAGSLAALAALALVLGFASMDADRLLRRARAARARDPPRAPLDLRAVAEEAAPAAAPPSASALAAPRAPPPRRRRPRKVDPQVESRAFERWRASLRRQDDDDSRSSEDEPRPAPPPPPPPYEPLPADERASADDEPPSSDSESSSPPEPMEDDDEPEEPRAARGRDRARARDERAPPGPDRGDEEPLAARPELPATPAEGVPRARRREPDARRGERRPEEGRAVRPPGVKHHARKDKTRARRGERGGGGERAPPTPPRSSPPAPEPRPAGGVRPGASWSSVVARSAQPAPAPAPPSPAPPPEPRWREEPPARVTPQDHSLFYFNGEAAPPPPPPAPLARPEPEYSWRAPPPARTFATPTRDFLGEESVGGAYGSIGAGAGGGSPWGGSLQARAPGAAWPWPSTYSSAPGSGAVRPPPGFGSTPANTGVAGSVGAIGSGGAGAVGLIGSGAPSAVGPVGSAVGPVGSAVGPVGSAVGPVGSAVGPVGSGAARGVRPFDPFQSLAAIWSRTALDWRHDEDDLN